MRLLLIPFFFVLSTVLTACSGGEQEEQKPSAPAMAEQGEKTPEISWPALANLEEAIHEAEEKLDSEEVVDWTQVANSVREAAITVAEDTPPRNARRWERVDLLQGELRRFADQLEFEAAPTREDFEEKLEPLHHTTVSLMKAAGMEDPGHRHREEEGAED